MVDERLLTVVMVGKEWVVHNTAETGITRIQPGGFLIEGGICHAEHQSAGVMVFELGLERIGGGMSEVSVAHHEVAKGREAIAGGVRVRRNAISVRGIANGGSVAHGSANRHIAGPTV